MNQPACDTTRFAKLFDIDGRQVLFEVSPMEDEDRFKVSTTLDLGWTRYQKDLELRMTKTMKDPLGYILDEIDQDRAERELAVADAQWGEDAMLANMDPQEEYVYIPPARFARLFDVDGCQVLAVQATADADELELIQEEDEDITDSTPLVRVKVAGDDGKVASFVMVDDEANTAFQAFDQATAQWSANEARGDGNDYVIPAPARTTTRKPGMA